MPNIPRPPEKGTSFHCPYCSAESSVMPSQIINGFTCPACGKKIEGIGGGSGQSRRSLFVCPKCGSKGPELLQFNDEGKHFRCRDCGEEW